MEKSNFVTYTPIGKIFKIFLSEIRRPRSLIFGMKLYLADLYEDCSNYSPEVKNGPTPRSHLFYINSYRENSSTVIFSETIWPIKSKVHMELNSYGERKFVCRILVT